MFVDFPADFRYVLGLQESVVVGMADGYAQATRNAAFVNLHSAVGVGHAMGAIFTAYKNRTPMVITAGQQSRSLLPFDPFLASARATELPRPYVKWAVEPARAEDVPLAIARAYYLAMMPPRGPVLVSVPADDWAVPHRSRSRRGAWPRRCAPTRRCWPRSAPRSTARAHRPSSSARRSTATAPGTRRCSWPKRHNARVFIAPMAGTCGFPGDHALFAGHLSPMRERIVAALAPHDVVLALGAPAFTYHVAGERAACAAGHAAVPADRRPRHRRLGAAGQCGAVQPEAGPARPAGAAGTARAAAAGALAAAGARRATGTAANACRWPTCCRRWPTCATRPASSSRRRPARGR